MFHPTTDSLVHMPTTPNTTTAARLQPGMTVQLVGLEPISTMHELLQADHIARGETHWVPCGALKSTGPVIVVASVDAEAQVYRNSNSVRVAFATGEVVQMSTRQKVAVV